MCASDIWINSGSRERGNDMFRVWQETVSDRASEPCGYVACWLGQMAECLTKTFRPSAVECQEPLKHFEEYSTGSIKTRLGISFIPANLSEQIPLCCFATLAF